MPAHRIIFAACSTIAIIGGSNALAARHAQVAPAPNADTHVERIAPYHARFGRARPVIAIVGLNGGTELTDYVIPYGILSAANVGEIVPIATEAGPMTMRPALRLQPQGSTADFDARVRRRAKAAPRLPPPDGHDASHSSSAFFRAGLGRVMEAGFDG